ncbi:tumor necrosis factor receptor superfamily member 6-like [Leucoraja erinacea]|uniref:tumor necrosis factor receptor superfamily member 6-like n=1 Tax=Leucoraja erinaceus TaxID=7782 RepID=UPI002455A2ED|nr:tumor necrosis factor receptor superfamily member 6-like [Leucoraja erinacea]
MDLTVLFLVLFLWNVRGTRPSSLTEKNVALMDSSTISTFGLSQPGFKRLKRQINCGLKEYWSADSTRCCAKCLAGQYVKKSCSETENSTCQECEQTKTYTEFENGVTACHACKACQEDNGQKIEENCTTTSNTKCSCRENFFCDTSPCKRCSLCKICDEPNEEIAHACTPTNDTVCRARTKEDNSHLGLLTIIPIMMIGVVGVLLYCKRKSLPCNRKTEEHLEQVAIIAYKEVKPEEQDVPDVELSDGDMHDIADEIEPRHYHQLGISLGLTEPKLQQIEADYRDDKSRQGFAILYEWLQSNGKRGALPKLIGILRNLGWMLAADNILTKLTSTKEISVEIPEKDVSETNGATEHVSVA